MRYFRYLPDPIRNRSSEAGGLVFVPSAPPIEEDVLPYRPITTKSPSSTERADGPQFRDQRRRPPPASGTAGSRRHQAAKRLYHCHLPADRGGRTPALPYQEQDRKHRARSDRGTDQPAFLIGPPCSFATSNDIAEIGLNSHERTAYWAFSCCPMPTAGSFRSDGIPVAACAGARRGRSATHGLQPLTPLIYHLETTTG